MQIKAGKYAMARRQRRIWNGWIRCWSRERRRHHEKLLAFFEDENKTAPYGNRSNAMIEMIVIMDIYKAEVQMAGKEYHP